MRLARPARRMLYAGLLVALVLVVGAEVLDGVGIGLLYLAPAVALALPLLAGRFLGADRRTEWSAPPARRPRRGAPALVATGRRAPRTVIRGGRLLACCMGRRGPPARLRIA
jgi:hypothetical protein